MSLSFRKVVTTSFAVAVLVASFAGFGLVANAQTNTAQVAQMQALLKLIGELQLQLAQLKGDPNSGGQCVQLSQTLQLGSSDATTMGEVTKLQQYLKKTGHYTYPQITGYYGPTTQEAVKSWQNKENFYEASGAGTIGSASRTKMAESCNFVTIDQRSVKSMVNTFKLSGSAKNVESIFVVLVHPYTSAATDWHSVYTTGGYVAFTGDTINKVVDGRWSVEFSGIRSGNYEARVYSNDDTNQKLLFTQPLTVTTPESFKFTAGSKKTITLGVGQTATDGGVTIRLNNVFLTDGLSGLPRANFIIEPEGYEPASYSAGLGGYLPEGGGGIYDDKAPNDGIRLKLKSISQSMNTVTFTVEATSPKG